MNEMVQRVSLAIRAVGRPEGQDFDEWCEKIGRAAIEAMREPTEAMTDAGTDGLYDRHQPEPLSGIVYRAMIDAALKDGP